MKDKKVGFAIIGCGHISFKHAQALQRIKDAELVAVCDINQEQLNFFLEEYKVNSYSSIEEMLMSEPNIDIVNICTPSGTHARIAVQVAEHKKHLVIEKPIALTLEDSDRIIKACEKNNVKLSVVHPNRFRPAIQELKKRKERGLFGKLSHLNATVRWNRNQEYYDQALWRGTKEMDGGVLMNQAIHNLDLLLWLADDIEEVQAMTTTRFRNIETEDVAIAIIKFKSGALGVIEAATTIYPKNLEESFSIFGEYGSAIISGTTANWIKHWEFKDEQGSISQELVQKIENDPFGVPGHQIILNDMVEAVKNNREPIVTGYAGRNAVKLVLSIIEAAEKKKIVKWNENLKVGV